MNVIAIEGVKIEECLDVGVAIKLSVKGREYLGLKDACIQDCGSYLVEYLYTGKPCCYMLKSQKDIEEKYAPLGQKCLEHCYITYDTGAIDAFIRDVIVGGRDPKADARKAFAKTVAVNYPNAAQVALDHIKEALT